MILLYILAAVVGAVVAIAARLFHVMPPVIAHPFATIAISVALSVIATLVAGFSTHNVALRRVTGPLAAGGMQPDPPAQLPHSARWYLETAAGTGPTQSCSFVEFDERGDYLDFSQHRHAYECVERLAGDARPLTLVIYVHGWRHSGQSSNVVAFNHFLGQIAAAYEDTGQSRRVHGVYLAWRGGLLRPTVARDDVFREVAQRYGGEVVDLNRAARFGALNDVLESASYFSRKSVPEHKVGGTAISRTLFTVAYAAKRKKPQTEVFLIGHSFGALMLERTFQNAIISQLTESWSWGAPQLGSLNPLPFDTVVLVNSAAPSIYAKQLQSYLAAHRQAMALAGRPGSDAPVAFSLTSEGDWATGKVHPIANRFAGWLPTLRRQYRGDDFILEQPGAADVMVPQAFYYRRTPGHNPLLVNRFVEPVSTERHGESDHRGCVRKNLTEVPADRLQFATAAAAGQDLQHWTIRFPPQTPRFDAFSRYDGRRPVVWTQRHGTFIYKETAYWIVRCPKTIIADHNDIWSQSAMDMYAALHRIALNLRSE